MGGRDATGAWHADGELLAAYDEQRLDAAARWSVEAHLTSCAACRLQARALVEEARLQRLRVALIEAVEGPRAGVAERLLVRLGVAEHTARLLAATPALRGSWLLAVATVLAFAVLAGWTHPGQDANLAFLCVAPLLPLAGIAAAYGPGGAPADEIGLAAPRGGAGGVGGGRLAGGGGEPGAAPARPRSGRLAAALPGADRVQPGAGHDGRAATGHRGHRRRLDPRGRGHRVASGAVVGPVRRGRAGRLRGLGA